MSGKEEGAAPAEAAGLGVAVDGGEADGQPVSTAPGLPQPAAPIEEGEAGVLPATDDKISAVIGDERTEPSDLDDPCGSAAAETSDAQAGSGGGSPAAVPPAGAASAAPAGESDDDKQGRRPGQEPENEGNVIGAESRGMGKLQEGGAQDEGTRTGYPAEDNRGVGGGGGCGQDEEAPASPDDPDGSKGLHREISWKAWKRPESELDEGELPQDDAPQSGLEAEGQPSPVEEGEAIGEDNDTEEKGKDGRRASKEENGSASRAGSKESGSKDKEITHGKEKDKDKDKDKDRRSSSRRRSRSRSHGRSSRREKDSSSSRRSDRDREKRGSSRDKDKDGSREKTRGRSPSRRSDTQRLSPPAPRRRDEPGPIFTRLQRGAAVRSGPGPWDGPIDRRVPGFTPGWEDARRGPPGAGPPFRGAAGPGMYPPGWRGTGSPDTFRRPRRSPSPPGAYSQMRRGPPPGARGRMGSPPLGHLGPPPPYGGRGPMWDRPGPGPPGPGGIMPGPRGGGRGGPHSPPPSMRGGFGGMPGRNSMPSDYGHEYGGGGNGPGGPGGGFGRGGMRGGEGGPGESFRGEKRPRDWRDDGPPPARRGAGWAPPGADIDSPPGGMRRGGGWGVAAPSGGMQAHMDPMEANGNGSWMDRRGNRGSGFGGGPGGMQPSGNHQGGMHPSSARDQNWSPSSDARMGGGGGGNGGGYRPMGGSAGGGMQHHGHHHSGSGSDMPGHSGGLRDHRAMETADAMGIGSVHDQEWYYTDPQGATQGPCSISEFNEWLTTLGSDPEYREEYLKFKDVRVWKHGLKQQIPLERLVQQAHAMMQ